MRYVFISLAIALLTFSVHPQSATQGNLYAIGKGGTDLGACPLKQTRVEASITGFIARVNVTQEFTNSFSEPIEAIYTFPLAANGAVDRMTMTVNSRVVRGKIMRREEAREKYEAAKASGFAASLLDQERPNIFTQAVANIMPGESIIVEISYVEMLKYEAGEYEFVFPMTVGPRYNPGSVSDAAKISPPIAPSRAGHDISIAVNINSGVPVESIRSLSHDITQVNLSPSIVQVSLRNEKTIPNRDFIVRYDVSGKRIEDAVLSHRGERGGFFTLILQPPDIPVPEERTPKEIVFVLDTSGSMYGFPIEKAKEAMRLSLAGLYPEDTFNLITFAGETSVLFDSPVPATQANLERAQAFLDLHQGSGGTEMMKAITAALTPSDSQSHLRIVCFMTDGYVGNEDEIVAEIKRHPNARIFSFGVGDSVNRHLLDKMAEAGNGEVEYVSLDDDGSAAAKRFYLRVRSPILTDISIAWNGGPVADVYPAKIGDLFSAKPVIVNGRYDGAFSGTIRLKGKIAGQEYIREIPLELPDSDPANDVLASLWARKRIDQLSAEALGIDDPTEITEQIIGLGLEFGLMTKFTSFVAVEERLVNPAGEPVRIDVPVENPEGVTRQDDSPFRRLEVIASIQRPPARPASGSGIGYGSGRGVGSGSGNAAVSQSVNASVSVSASSDDEVVSMPSTLSTTITRQTVAELPKGMTFSGLLKLTPGVTPVPLGGGFQIDGASGSENVFVIDGTEVLGYRARSAGKKDGDQLTGTASVVAEPIYPAEAAKRSVLGTVRVAVNANRFGVIISARAISGPRTLREASVAAALLSKFSPPEVDGKPVRLSGVFVYAFEDAETVTVSVESMKARLLTHADKREIALAEKLHAVLYRIATGNATDADSSYIMDGKVVVSITVSGRAASVLKQLTDGGLESSKVEENGRISGVISAGDLGRLVEIRAVRLVLPAR